ARCQQNRVGPGSGLLHPFGRKHELLTNARFHRRVAGVRDDHVLRLGPSASELVGATDRADHVIAALYDDPGDPPDLYDPCEQIAFRWKQVAAEKMGFD